MRGSLRTKTPTMVIEYILIIVRVLPPAPPAGLLLIKVSELFGALAGDAGSGHFGHLHELVRVGLEEACRERRTLRA